MVQIQIHSNADMSQTQKQFTQLTATVAALNEQLAKSSTIAGAGTAAVSNFRKLSTATQMANTSFAQTLAASNAFAVSNVRVSDAVKSTTDALAKQKLGFREVFGRGNRDLMKATYAQQLAMQDAQVRFNRGLVTTGKLQATMAMPRNVSESWNTMANRVGMFSTQLSSASRQLLNWGKNTQWAGRQLTVGLTVPMGILGIAAGKLAYDVDKSFTEIAKVYDVSAAAQQNESKRTAEINALRVQSLDNARVAAEKYGIAMSDTLDIEQQFAAAGFNKSNGLFGMTKETSRISFLGGIDATQAAEMNRTLMTVFKDQIKNTDQLHDKLNFLNAVSNATSLSLQDIAEAVPRAATGFAQLGGTVEQMAIALVSMREAGVDAASGANALKSATTRIINPVKKAKDFYDQFGISLETIASQSGGNLFKYLQILGKEQNKIQGPTEEQTKLLRAQGVAALFGTYQNNRLTAALTNMTDAYAGVNNQTSRAIALQAKSSDELEKIAKDTENIALDQISVKFRRALETFKAELTDFGAPFLEIATWLLKLTSGFMGFFNSLPHGIKLVTAVGIGFAAIIGPTIMLVGLFANLAAQAGLLVGWLGRTASGWKFVTESEWLAQQAAKAANSSFVKQADAATLATERVEALNTALIEYIATLEKAPGVAAMGITQQGVMGQAGVKAQTAVVASNARPRNERGQFISASAAAAREEEKAQAAILATQEKQAAAEAKKAKFIREGAASTALMGAGMATMMFSSNETAQHFGEMALTLGLVAPMVKGLGPVIVTAGRAAKAAIAAQVVAMGGFKGAAQGSLVAVRALGAGLVGLLGPIGLTIAALGAIGILAYKWYKHEKAISEEKRKQVEATNQENESLNRGLGISEKHLATLQKIDKYKATTGTDTADLAKSLKNDSQTKKEISAFKDSGSAVQSTILRSLYSQIIDNSGDVAKAQQGVEAFLLAVGKDSVTAATGAKELANELGRTVDLAERQANWEGLANQAFNNGGKGDDAIKSAKAAGTSAGKEFISAFVHASAEEKPQVTKALMDSLNDAWNKPLSELQGPFSQWGPELKKLGIQTGEQLRNAMNYAKGDINTVDAKSLGLDPNMLGEYQQIYRSIGDDSDKRLAYERSISAEILKQMGIQADIKSMSAAQVQWILQAQNASNKIVKTVRDEHGAVIDTITAREQLYNQGMELQRQAEIRAKGLKGEEKANYQVSEAGKLMVINIIRAAQGYAQADSTATGLGDTATEAAQKTETLKRSIDSLRDKRIRINVDVFTDAANMSKIWQGAANSATSGLADVASQRLEDAGNARMNALQVAQEKQSAALDAAQSKQSDGAEKHAKSAEKGIEAMYDKRIAKVKAAIDAEKKADETRQKLFEAEKTRLQRLADIQNKNIDFNTALQTGQMDEAAKIANDMQATTSEWNMEDADARAQSRSDARVSALEKQQERLEKMKDKALDRIKAREEAEKSSLKNVQDAQKASLKAQQDAQKASLQKQLDQDKKSLAARLDLLKALPINNRQQLEAALKIAGLKISDFGAKTMPQIAKMWQGTFNNTVRTEGAKLQQDSMWEALGASSFEKVLAGMGFSSAAALAKFVKTGNLPADFGKVANHASATSLTNPVSAAQAKKNRPENRHEGGWIGSGPGSRKGVARTQPGLGPGETWVRAQKGEYMVDKDNAAKHGDVLNAMSNGIYDPVSGARERKMDKGIMGGYTGGGMAGVFAAIAARAAQAGVAKAIQNKVNAMVSVGADAGTGYSGTFGGVKAGKYGDMGFDSEQLKNAGIIASVGKSMGMSSRDIEIGIMTSITESMLRNVNYGDRDSLGLFQQRPSQGWGSPSQVTNPNYAAQKFFSVLKNHTERGGLSPWMAAQSVQRSAFSDGSNYRQYWNEAEAIFGALQKSGTSTSTGGYIPGPGGKHRPVNSGSPGGIHDQYTGYPAVDIPVPVGTPVYAVADGTVTRSYDLPGYEPRNRTQNGYRSYGKVMYLKTDAGPEVLYAHLSSRSVGAGTRVKGGSRVAYSGNLGHSTGPHLHFGAKGASPLAYMKVGGTTVGDGPRYLHDGETVLTKPLSNDLHSVVSTLGAAARRSSWNNTFASMPGMGSLSGTSVASGGGDTYNVNIVANAADMDENRLADVVISKIKQHNARKTRKGN